MLGAKPLVSNKILNYLFRFWKRDKGFKLDDAVWAEPEIPKADCLPEAKVRKNSGTRSDAA